MNNRSLRFLRFRAQTALSKGTRPGAETSVMKLAYARFMQQMTTAAIHLQGATGMLAGTHLPAGGVWTTKFLHAPSLRIAGDFELWARFFEHADLYGVDVRVDFIEHIRDIFAQLRDAWAQIAGGAE